MILSEIGSLQEYEEWWEKEARPLYEEWLRLPFFAELRAGKLGPERLIKWLENWYNLGLECDMHRPVLWPRHHYIIGRYPELEEIVTERGGKPLNHPYPGGHVTSLRKLGSALGKSHQDLLGARVLPQTVHLAGFLKSLYLEGTLAEFASQLIGEEHFIEVCASFQKALAAGPFNLAANDLDYFKYWPDCLLMKYGSPGRFLLRSLFEKGLVEERPNFGIRHAATRHAEYLLRLYGAL